MTTPKFTSIDLDVDLEVARKPFAALKRTQVQGLFVALLTELPGPGCENGQEVVAANYRRQAVVLSKQRIAWPTASSNWGSIAGFAVYQESSGGEMLFYTAFTMPISCNAGEDVYLSTPDFLEVCGGGNPAARVK
jgi:hypothetical protein